MDEKPYQKVAQDQDIPRGKTLCMEVGAREVLLCHTADEDGIAVLVDINGEG